MAARSSARLEGLTSDEYLWEPVASCWTVRETAEGVRADWADPNPDPAPVTTIAWRLWHVAVDCLDSYSARVFGRHGTDFVDQAFTLDVERGRSPRPRPQAPRSAPGSRRAAAGDCSSTRSARRGVRTATRRSSRSMLHVIDEVIHHSAEIALLRDLYRARALA